jgi:hypothetical protein
LNSDSDNLDELLQLKCGLSKLREIKMQGVFVRSRARWISEGEKVTSYFCALALKSNFIKKKTKKNSYST